MCKSVCIIVSYGAASVGIPIVLLHFSFAKQSSTPQPFAIDVSVTIGPSQY